jgi:tRNA-splicing ligase RtcB (3'-phosphate/5'-hydroxy nucleic acid ligase)
MDDCQSRLDGRNCGERKMKSRELQNLGIPKGEPITLAIEAIPRVSAKIAREDLRALIKAVAEMPDAYLADPIWQKLAHSLVKAKLARAGFVSRREPAPYRRWGADIDGESIRQMDNACNLPISYAGALMPDAHVGYGLPIGGVLATCDAVIPYAVGMDIACRMKMTVLDFPISAIRGEEGHLRKAIEKATSFGVGGGFKARKEHPVMEEDWAFSTILRKNRDRAWHQLGSSGSGNHFVEFGTLTLDQDDLGLKSGVYCALLSHSGSRGTGGDVATHYSKLAMNLHPELPKELMHLAWLGLDTDAGQEYWHAMELMGKYAAANHYLIHRDIAKLLNVRVLLDIENHHNYAWKENHFGRDLIVHRKGATPAGKGTIGIIPGSMATPGYVVRGKGVPESMNSAAHGAGRRLSRTMTKSSYTWHDGKKFLAEHDVVLISAGLDEVPMGYKDIESVMTAQADLIEIVARFDPKLVKMAPEGERPED